MAVSSVLRRVGGTGRDDDRGSPTSLEAPGDAAESRTKGASVEDGFVLDERRVERAVLAFVALGVLLRIGHYLANYPLWGDEAFLALSYLRRGYLGLLLPLEYGQICPILFLWAELTAVKLFGFSEMSLRLCPLICGVASVFLFRHAAGRMLKGPALLMAVAIFAVSIHPIRHSADAKPYASDLLVALCLLALAIEWCVSSERTAWLWMLVGFAPIALAASYPAALVEGGIGLALAPSVWRARRRGPKIALAAYVLVVATTFAGLFAAIVHRRQSGAVMPALQRYWADSFPPLDSPARLTSWLISTHAGSMFAYPWGGNRGASSGTLLVVLIGAVVLWRQGRKTIFLLLLAPMGVALTVAALRLYPYGGQARITQYLAPAICLMAGLGLSTVLECFPRTVARVAALRVAIITLAVAGLALLEEDIRHPYRALYDHQVREFARRFWPEQARGSDLACLQWDFGIYRRHAAGTRTALYLCNQHIYSPIRIRGGGPRLTLVTQERPFRCICFDELNFKSPETTAWLGSMNEKYKLRGQLDLVVPTMGLDMKPWNDHVYVFDFEPKGGQKKGTCGKID